MRRSIIHLALVALVLSWTGAAWAAKHTLVFQSVYPKNHMRFLVVEDILDQIEAKSKGEIKFDRHYTEPVSTKEALNALGKGTIDVLAAYPTYYDGKIAVGDWQQLPSNFRTWEDSFDLCVQGKVAEIMDAAYQKRAQAKYLTATPVAPYNFQVAKRSRKIRKFEDFKGLKIRSAGGSASIAIKELGASPVMTVGGEYYQAMQKGVIDAGLMTTYSLKQYRLWEVADQIVDPPLIGYSSCFLWMNLATWQKLGPDLQKMVQATARDRHFWDKWTKVYDEKQDGPIIKEAKEKGVEFFVLPEPEAEKMYQATEPVWDWYVKQCAAQGFEAEAKEVRRLIKDRFNRKK